MLAWTVCHPWGRAPQAPPLLETESCSVSDGKGDGSLCRMGGVGCPVRGFIRVKPVTRQEMFTQITLNGQMVRQWCASSSVPVASLKIVFYSFAPSMRGAPEVSEA
ncbi:hypothetical protein GCM10009525_10530 [Streptosporangium amethystogenes subsp. fukuiense]